MDGDFSAFSGLAALVFERKQMTAVHSMVGYLVFEQKQMTTVHCMVGCLCLSKHR